MVDSSSLRVSDQDREEAARLIREHYAAGRLDDRELNERLEAAYAARTEGDLALTLADLPPLPATRSAELAEVRARRSHLQRRLLQQSGGGMTLFVLGTAVWLTDGATGQFWPVWVLIVVLIPLLRGAWRLYGPAPDLDRVEAELERRERHAERQSRRAERRARRDR
ncbi:MAG TPA: DUF1707 domain-containing protein [Solirubrobacteraceae bacterium]|nr:DUF1707 domain-containing protein [Solirubrobacteraceae bacterium]